jgi:UDP-N-acetylglucosamine--N-acetylmuramyl-(pentapeptide) pyrophosphoryl-undecaprenol N-acetylglucosamine transferase
MSNMDLVVTGGGTGGHIYPTLAVAAAAAADGATIRYLGSYRGQERAICKASNIEFKSFDAQPIYSMKTPAGWLSAIRLVRASSDARRYLRKNRPELVFSTGGYSAAPVVSAARSLRIPYVIHESNSVPGRSNAMFVKASRFFTCTFEATKSVIPKAERTGQPVRKELRVAANKQRTEPATSRDVVLGIGGSQGSTFLNKTLIEAAKDFSKKRCRFVLAAGRNNFMEVQQTLSSPEAPDNFKAVTYLELPDLVDTYGKTVIAVGRSGGTVAEMAMFGLPSVLIPLPTAFANHQMINAQEMERIGGAVVLDQAKTSGKELANAIRYWLESPEKREAARTSLQEWDIPDATERIYSKLIAALAAPA